MATAVSAGVNIPILAYISKKTLRDWLLKILD
jgi:hypothetical protein